MTSLESGGVGALVARFGVEVRTTQLRAARAVSAELVSMYRRVGRLILDGQQPSHAGDGTDEELVRGGE